MAYLLIALTVLLNCSANLALKWQVGRDAAAGGERAWWLQLLRPGVIAAAMVACLAMASWILVLRRLPLTVAYPFTSISYVILLLAGCALFHEPLTAPKAVGVALIVVGVAVSCLGAPA
jgi:multidrug transporter EmrE-like cation transporter